MKPAEIGALLWSFAFFFCLLCAYYILRPIREEMGIRGGVENLPWMFTATFVAMLAFIPLYAAAFARFPRSRFIPLIYHFFALHLVGFFVALRGGVTSIHVAHVFYVWLNVFNLFVTSSFWSVMAELWHSEQSKRLFGFIAAGGSLGGIVGPLFTKLLVGPLGTANLLLGSILFLEIAALCVHRLFRLNPGAPPDAAGDAGAQDKGRKGVRVFEAVSLIARSPYLLGICAQTILTTWTATFLYLQQMSIVKAAIPDSAQRTALFAQIDLYANVFTAVFQALATGHILEKAGLAVALGVVPVVTGIGFLGLLFKPVVWLVIAFQVLRRVAHFALERPTREVLFTVVSPEEKYKSKSFIDTVIYRGSDFVSSWIYTGLSTLIGTAPLSMLIVLLSGGWLGLTTRLARAQAARARAEAARGDQPTKGEAEAPPLANKPLDDVSSSVG